MTDEKLIELLKSMSLSEKISQLVQLHGGYFGEARQLTGPEQQFNISEKRAYSIGSIFANAVSSILRAFRMDLLRTSRTISRQFSWLT